MKKSLKTEIVEHVEIDFENSFFVNYKTINGRLDNYLFSNINEKKLHYIPKEILPQYTTSHWSNHIDIEIPKFKTLEELENFNKFDDLYYIGYSSDGMLRKADKTPITSQIYLSDIYFRIYQQLETSEKECQKFLDNLNHDYITEYHIIDTPYYNQNENLIEHYTISLRVNLPQEIYSEIFTKTKAVSVDDYVKNEVVEFLKRK